MNNKVNYKNLHLNELEEALNNLDQESYPGEAEYIRKLIIKGGYQYPENTNYGKTEITNNVFKWMLVAVIFIFLCVNIITLVKSHYIWSIIPIIIHTSLLGMIFTKSTNLKFLIKLWFGIIIVGNFLGFYMLLVSSEPLNYMKLAEKSIIITIAIITIWLTNKFMIMRSNTSDEFNNNV